MGFSTTHLLIFLVIIVVIFGTKKLRNIGADLGGAVKGFKDAQRPSRPKRPLMLKPKPRFERAAVGFTLKGTGK